MKQIVVTLLLLITLATSLNANNDTTFAPYLGYTSYKDDNKSNGVTVGFYGATKNSNHLFEYGFEYKQIGYDKYFSSDSNSSDTNSTDSNSTSIADTKQKDFTLSYTYNHVSNLKFKLALHYIISSQNSSDNSLIGLIGLQQKIDKLYFGVNFYGSRYTNDALANKVYQLSPFAGYNFGDYNSLMGTYYIKLKLDYINLGSKNQNIDTRYNSYTLALTQFKGMFENTIQFVGGDSLYKVSDNGFSVNNFNDIYSTSFNLSSKYKLDDNQNSIMFSYSMEKFKGYGNTLDAKANNFLVSYYFNF